MATCMLSQLLVLHKVSAIATAGATRELSIAVDDNGVKLLAALMQALRLSGF